MSSNREGGEEVGQGSSGDQEGRKSREPRHLLLSGGVRCTPKFLDDVRVDRS
jgi:hypothetical protein